MHQDEVEIGLIPSARSLASITDLDAFRRDRALNNWFVVLYLTCLGVFSGALAMKVSPLFANINGIGF